MKGNKTSQVNGINGVVLTMLMSVLFVLTSCLRDNGDDDGYGGLSPSDKYKYVTAVAGSYSGYLYLQPGYDGIYSATEKVDSLPMNWQVEMEKDTTATLQSYNFPVSFLGMYRNVIPSAEARNILLQGLSQPLTAKLTPLSHDNSLYAFWMLPQSNIGDEQEYVYTVEYDGEEHVVSVVFSVTSLQVGSGNNSLFQYPLATYSDSKRSFVGTLLLSSVTVDGMKYNINAFVNIASKQKQ